MQKVALVHDTLSSSSPVDGAGAFGLGVIDQALPFQVSTRVSWPAYPTATQKVAVGHESP